MTLLKSQSPLLSAGFDLDNLESELAALEYPVIGSPKMDGYRILQHPELGAVTRKFLRLPNYHIFDAMRNADIPYMDGELTVGPPYDDGITGNVFARSNCIMQRESIPTDFQYHVFDYFIDADVPYAERLLYLEERVKTKTEKFPWIKFVEPRLLSSPDEVLRYEEEQIDKGYEGIMLRSLDGPYKFGRSTLRQQILIKLKRVVETDATVIGYEPRFHNANEPTKDNLGYTKRSSHKENMEELAMLGRLICQSAAFSEPFSIGSGFDHSFAHEWWEARESLPGKTLSFKYQKTGTKVRPRHPIFLRWQNDR
jgi:DNA ligase-1